MNACLRGRGLVDDTLTQLEELYDRSLGERLDREYD